MYGKHGAHLKRTQKQCRIPPLWKGPTDMSWVMSRSWHWQMFFQTSSIRVCLGFPCYRWETITNVFHHANKDIKPSEQERRVSRGDYSACMHTCVYIALYVHLHVRAEVKHYIYSQQSVCNTMQDNTELRHDGFKKNCNETCRMKCASTSCPSTTELANITAQLRRKSFKSGTVVNMRVLSMRRCMQLEGVILIPRNWINC